jgi:uncharacterized protein (UPF0303 family)
MTSEQELQAVLEQENALVFPRFDASIAKELGVALEAAAARTGSAVTIDIRRGDDLVYFFAMPGTTPENTDWARRKRNVVELMRRSSYAVGLDCLAKGVSLEQKSGLPLRDFACHGGSFPIRVHQVGHIGTITVSGLPQREDHGLIVGVIGEWLERCADGQVAR